MNTQRAKPISGDTSLFLDTIRIVAATTVLVTHANDQWDTPAAGQLNAVAHAAVVVFFVLSGYVIAFSTGNDRGPRQYAIARLSRLYSMVIPALLLTALVELLTLAFKPTLAAAYTREHTELRYAMSIFFLSESGSFSASPPMNNPLWSLNFEFWYYALFGIWLYRVRVKGRYILLFIACCLAGPKILLLMPIWLFGVLAYQLPRPVLSRGVAWLAVFALLVTAGLTVIYFPATPFSAGIKPFYFANQFVTDWVIGVLFAAALAFLPVGNTALSVRLAKPVRFIADLSFPLYVMHYPLLILWRLIFGWQINDKVGMWEATLVVFLITMLLGIILERYRGIWSKFFNWIINLFSTQHVIKPKGV